MNTQIFDAFFELGFALKNNRAKTPFKSVMKENPWFTSESVDLAIQGIIHYLEPSKMSKWIHSYEIPSKSQTIGIIMAGNLPAVGFHDLLCALVAGHNVQIKLSSKDTILPSFIVKTLIKINPVFKTKIKLVNGVENCDAYIATGSNNTARYFEYYFKNKPALIRKNRSSVAVVTGKEDKEELMGLTNDIFQYFGLGCRSVSHLILPSGYRISKLKPFLLKYDELIESKPFLNNLNYSRALLTMSKNPFKDFGNILFVPKDSPVSPIGVVNYSFYNSLKQAYGWIKNNNEDLQCIFSQAKLAGIKTYPFGKSQFPELWDYSDGKDTMLFLTTF